MYIKRYIEETLRQNFAAFPAVLLTGARQVGKGMLLANTFRDIHYDTLDDRTIFSVA